jgi:hypothetical protein
MNENFLTSGADMNCFLYYLKNYCENKQTKRRLSYEA